MIGYVQTPSLAHPLRLTPRGSFGHWPVREAPLGYTRAVDQSRVRNASGTDILVRVIGAKCSLATSACASSLLRPIQSLAE
jgi:hypothetical protein